MRTLLLSVGLIVSGFAVWKISWFALNIAGLPGVLIAWRSSDKSQSLAGALRFFVGVIISALGQSYVYLIWVALVVNFTKDAAQGEGVFGPALWPVAFIASFAPIYLWAAAGAGEAATGESEWVLQRLSSPKGAV
jgi:hypothetical protein